MSNPAPRNLAICTSLSCAQLFEASDTAQETMIWLPQPAKCARFMVKDCTVLRFSRRSLETHGTEVRFPRLSSVDFGPVGRISRHLFLQFIVLQR